MEGYYHSIESFGTVDGPGIRLVLFLQGCPLRCKYCHNPDTWETKGGKTITADEVLSLYEKNKSFYQKGGITVTGGEPLLQLGFVTELFKKAKEKGIHTCLDTSGITFKEGDTNSEKSHSELLKYTDLIMLDIKHIDTEKHKALTGAGNENTLAFARLTEKLNIPLWVRHVVIEGITDNKNDLTALGKFIGTLSNLKALDVLPYHTMGINKYEQLDIKYPLKDMKALDKMEALKAKEVILDGIRGVRG